jgi:hypothetical protein
VQRIVNRWPRFLGLIGRFPKVWHEKPWPAAGLGLQSHQHGCGESADWTEKRPGFNSGLPCW